ncbi:TonB-dependent receptor [Massilia sp. TSP1-1-2]|uniref:TonB-dependent receptor n=1 Tax=unclassified Massilia TaxID=2609279 RepID=UPI003CF0C609
MEQKKLSWMIASLFTLPAVGANAFAQQAPAPAAEPVQTITVSGIRASVRNALAVKEASNSMVEVIASEDIGKLPDTTIAESLARLPGLSAGLDRGNASQVVSRGLGPRFIGATLNGRELATSEPDRAVRFEQFPSESISGATIYKTQSAELVEGGIATTIDLQTVSPLKFSKRMASFKADALYYELAKDIPGAKKFAPRLGGIYVDQFADKTVGVALAASYQNQPSVQKLFKHYGFNTYNPSGVANNAKAPWGFEDGVKRGTNERASVLGKVEWKASPNAFLSSDIYYSKSDIREPELSHWSGDTGSWEGSKAADYSNPVVKDGYIVGATVRNVGLTTNDSLWTQDMNTLAGGVNGKFNVGDWKLETDLFTSKSERESQWRNLRQFSKNGATVNFLNPGDGKFSYNWGQDTGNPANFGNAELHISNYEHLRDRLSGMHLNAARSVDFGYVSKIKVGLRATDRTKSFEQAYWDFAGKTIPGSAFEAVPVDGLSTFLGVKDWTNTVLSTFGGNAFNPDGRSRDQLAGWTVKERNTAAYVQGDLEGELMGYSFRGNTGVRFVRTSQVGEGAQSLNGTVSPTSVKSSYSEVLPSLNLIFNLDAKQEHQLRFSVARAMARAPVDDMRGSRNLSLDTLTPNRPLTGSTGNPELKPMMSNQVDLAYQWYFGKGSLLSGGVFYKDLSRYIGIATVNTTIDGRPAVISRPVNGDGGGVRGAEVIYQQLFANGIGLSANYSYSTSGIEETYNGLKMPLEGLMKHNGGLTVWYEKDGYEARLSANYHSPYTRIAGWDGVMQQNEAETYVSMNFAKQLTPQLQLRFGMDNITNQKSIYTSNNIAYQQEVREFGRRFNLGLSFKL